MPAKRRPPFEMEPGEGKAHEAAESPEEETREGSEEAEGENYPMKSRKRSARGAKRTKAPMDAEGGCCNEKKGKAPCAACAAGKACSGAKRGGAKADGDAGSRSGGGCSSGPGTRLASSCSRGDALTPWEYLDACELGIQDRSRAYIRARLDAGVKCGGGYIAQGKKCRNGAGGGAMPSRSGRTGGKGLRSTEGGGPGRRQRIEQSIQKHAGNTALLTGIGSFAAAATGHHNLAKSLGRVSQAAGVTSNLAQLSHGAGTGNKAEIARGAGGIAATAAIAGVKGALQKGVVSSLGKQRANISKKHEQYKAAGPMGRYTGNLYTSTDRKLLKKQITMAKQSMPLSAARRRKAGGAVRSLWADGFSYKPNALEM